MRKGAEKDANMIANRILMLEKEEQRILRKIEKSRQRADEIHEVKRNNE